MVNILTFIIKVNTKVPFVIGCMLYRIAKATAKDDWNLSPSSLWPMTIMPMTINFTFIWVKFDTPIFYLANSGMVG